MSPIRSLVLLACSALLASVAFWALQSPVRQSLGGGAFVFSVTAWFIAPALILAISPLRLLPIFLPFVALCVWSPADGFDGQLIAVTVSIIASCILLGRLVWSAGHALWRMAG